MATNSTGQIRIFHPSPSLSEENPFTDYELFEGETVIGIGCKKRSKCQVINIPYNGSSVAKEHCRVLIDDNEHFIMDLGTKGKTKRRSHVLKPNVYYELSDGIDLTLGDLKCQYFTAHISSREKEEETKLVDETDLNETRSINTDATATPSPRPAHSIQMSPLPTLPSFDADNADITGCGSPQLLADPPELTTSEPEPTLAYKLSSSPQKDGGSHADSTDENDQTLPFDSPIPEDRPITNGVTMDANNDKVDDKVEAGGDIVNASDEGEDDLDTTVIIAEDTTDTEPYNLEEEQEKEGGEGGKEDKTKALVGPSSNTKGGPLASLFNEDDNEAPPLYEPTIAYNLEEDEERELSSVHSEETGTREKSEEEEKKEREEEEKKEREEEEKKEREEEEKKEREEEEEKEKKEEEEEKEEVKEKETEETEVTTVRGRKGKRGRGGPPASTSRGGRKRKSPRDVSPESEDKEKVKGTGSSLIDDNTVKDEITKQTESCGDISTNTKSSSTTKRNTKKRRKTPSPSPSLPDDGVATSSRRTRSQRDPPKSDKSSFDELYSVPEEPIPSEEPPVIPTVSSTDDTVVKKGKGKRGQLKRSKKTEQNPLSLESEEPLIAVPEEPPTATSEEPPMNTSEELPIATPEEPPTATSEEPPTATSEEPPTAISKEPPIVTQEEPPPPPASVSSITSSEDPFKPKSTRSRRQPRATKKSKKVTTTEEQLSDQESLDKEPLPDKSGEHPTSANEELPSSKSKRPRRQPAASKKKKVNESLSENESEDPLAIDDDIDTKKTLPKSKKLKGSVLELERMKPSSNGKKKETASSLDESPHIPSLSHTKRSTATRSTPRRTLQKGTTDSPSPPPSVLFTGVMDDEAEGIVTELGGRLVDSAADSTHCVTDKVRRTVKFLCCLAKGCHIVSIKWLKDCHKEGRFIPVDPYIIKDSTTEKQYKFSLKNSITAARKNSLLSGWRVFLTENIKPSPSDMTFIINCAGGEVIEKCPTESKDNTFIISCDMDKKSLPSVGIPVCTSEVILTGVLQQKLELDKYQLSTGSLSAVSGSATPKKTSKRRRQ